METVLLVIHLLIAVALVAVVLLQRSEGGALGIGGGAGGGGAGLMSARGTANILTRTTAILAACFFVSSIALALLAGQTQEPASVLDVAPAKTVPQDTQTDQPQVPVPGSN
ncbi:preprotein translocase subunit SecG [Aestuariispira ectoiniformans]|uniref:preprotein translocase subunit SecG n=1 Tax=Aestuariispira ectoiniformans TaxID=2775080 RepID=UPI0021E4DF86|nr:preprotein translocase subunit SecG [Aestuariispira ectoiniformans]